MRGFRFFGWTATFRFHRIGPIKSIDWPFRPFSVTLYLMDRMSLPARGLVSLSVFLRITAMDVCCGPPPRHRS
jgi:hypothetical protein